MGSMISAWRLRLHAENGLSLSSSPKPLCPSASLDSHRHPHTTLKTEAEGGLDDAVREIIAAARAAGAPVVFALTRKRLGEVRSRSSEWGRGCG